MTVFPERLIPGRNAILALLIFAVMMGVASRFPAFIAPANLADVLDDTSILIILALGQMLVLLTRAVDLSVAANLALTGMLAALLNARHPEWGVAPVLLLSLGAGTLLGGVNALLVWLLQLPSIVVTLGTMAVYRGAIYLITNGAWMTSKDMSDSFMGFIRFSVMGLTLLTWVAIMIVIAAGFFLKRTGLGRNLFVAGGNPAAAAYAGVDPGKMQALAFVISGALAGLCGYFWVARYAIAYVEVAQGFELQVIAACVIGGVSIAGGVGSVTGVVLGALFLGVVKNALPLIGISPFWQMTIAGAVIILAVAINARSGAIAGRRILEEKPA